MALTDSNVLKLAPNCKEYPEHDHQKDGQEEVYVVLEGTAILQADDEEWPMKPGMFVRLAPTKKRKFITRDEGATILALGNTPGKAYEPRS